LSDVIRYVSPVQGPQGLAWDGSLLWITSCVTKHLYAIDPQTRAVRHEYAPPHEALGIACAGSEFSLVVAPAIDEDLERDHRYVYSFTPEAGFAERFPCPDFSGSFLAYDSGVLYLSQAWDKKLVELDEDGRVVRDVQLERRPVGITIVDGAFYLATVGEDWNEGLLQRMPLQGEASEIETLRPFPFKPRGVAFDGERFWTNDRNNHAIVSFSITA
jgi:hypothetical protein